MKYSLPEPFTGVVDVARYSGYRGIVTKHDQFGHHCGYVLLSNSHPMWGLPTSELQDFSVHGGVTWSEAAIFDCRIYWAVGFDCNHGCDYAPGCPAGRDPKRYKSIAFAKKELGSLAYQLRKKQIVAKQAML